MNTRWRLPTSIPSRSAGAEQLHPLSQFIVGVPSGRPTSCASRLDSRCSNMRAPFGARATGTTGARERGRASCEPSRIPFATGASQCRADWSYSPCCSRPRAAIKRMSPHLRKTPSRLPPPCPPTSSSISARAVSTRRAPRFPAGRQPSSMPPRGVLQAAANLTAGASPSTTWAMFSSKLSSPVPRACPTRVSAQSSTTFPARSVMREMAVGALRWEPSHSARCCFVGA